MIKTLKVRLEQMKKRYFYRKITLGHAVMCGIIFLKYGQNIMLKPGIGSILYHQDGNIIEKGEGIAL